MEPSDDVAKVTGRKQFVALCYTPGARVLTASHDHPEPGVRVRFSLMRKQVRRGAPSSTVCLHIEGAREKETVRSRPQGTQLPEGFERSSVCVRSLKGLSRLLPQHQFTGQAEGRRFPRARKAPGSLPKPLLRSRTPVRGNPRGHSGDRP